LIAPATDWEAPVIVSIGRSCAPSMAAARLAAPAPTMAVSTALEADDVLYHMLLLTDEPATVAKCGTVSSGFRRMSLDEKLWERMCRMRLKNLCFKKRGTTWRSFFLSRVLRTPWRQAGHCLYVRAGAATSVVAARAPATNALNHITDGARQLLTSRSFFQWRRVAPGKWVVG
jgi:hypothetical protein